jgi:hypothetical protein
MAVNTLERAAVHTATTQGRTAQRIGRGLISFFAGLGLLLSGYIVIADIVDVFSTDQTRGGYEAPYTDFTGTPIQIEQVALEYDQLIIRGRVIDSEISCRTGMWNFNLLGLTIPYRTVSERALVVHQPQAFCRAAGFDTASWDMGY